MKVFQQIAAAFTIIVVTDSKASAEKSGTSFLRHRILPAPSCANVKCAAGCSIENPCATGETCVPCNDGETGCTAACTVANLDCGGYYKCEAATTNPTTTTATSTTIANAGVQGGCLVTNTVCGGNTGYHCNNCCSNSYINTQGTKTCTDVTTTTVATAAAAVGGTSSPTSSPSAGPSTGSPTSSPSAGPSTGSPTSSPSAGPTTRIPIACPGACQSGSVCDTNLGVCKLDVGESCTLCPTFDTQCDSSQNLSCEPTDPLKPDCGSSATCVAI